MIDRLAVQRGPRTLRLVRNKTLEAELDVVGGKVVTVAPLDALAQVERPEPTVRAHREALRQPGDQIALRIVAEQRLVNQGMTLLTCGMMTSMFSVPRSAIATLSVPPDVWPELADAGLAAAVRLARLAPRLCSRRTAGGRRRRGPLAGRRSRSAAGNQQSGDNH